MKVLKQAQDTGEVQSIVDRFYLVLSYVDCDFSETQQKDTLQKLFLDICDILDNEKMHILKRELIYSSLLGKQSADLVREFCRIDFKRKYDLKENEYSLERSHDSLSEEEAIMKIIEGSNKGEMWKNMFLLSWKTQRHILDIIMVTISFVNAKMKGFSIQ